MNTFFYFHPSFLAHDTGAGHPESAQRLEAILAALADAEFDELERVEAPRGSYDQVRLIHREPYIETLKKALPSQGCAALDPDTIVSPGSEEAAMRAVGAACAAVDAVLAGAAGNAFCAVRPPGHHAEPGRAMGFCLFNNIAIAAAHARSRHRLKRVAIVDFDVHHGNGTQAAFIAQPEVLYVSTHQHPFYPGTGDAMKAGPANIINVPLAAGSGSDHCRRAMEETVLPALTAFNPELLLVSAGFDAHRDDPLAALQWHEDDYQWISRRLLETAASCCRGRLVAVLEGGYHLGALGRCVAAYVRELLAAPADASSL